MNTTQIKILLTSILTFRNFHNNMGFRLNSKTVFENNNICRYETKHILYLRMLKTTTSLSKTSDNNSKFRQNMKVIEKCILSGAVGS